MKHNRLNIFLIAALVFGLAPKGGFANDDLLRLKPAPLTSEEAPPEKSDPLFLLEAAATPESPAPVLSVGGRIDVAFSGGTPVSQGFYIPSLRLNATGSLGRHLDYGMAIGQTREFSSALLPQLLPVEAYMAVKTAAEGPDLGVVKCQLGMFNPMLNPWWTPDLAALPLPDYHAIHRLVLLDNDIGLELTYQPIPETLEVSLGLFNGNGIFSPNTNNSKAFSGSLRSSFEVKGARVTAGFGAYSVEQSGPGSVNFKFNWMSNVFASVQTDFLLVGLDFSTGRFEDSVRAVQPSGIAGFANVTVLSGVKIFSRLESLKNSPSASGGSLTQFQLGPLIEIDKAFRAFFYYESIQTSAGGSTPSGQIRLRMAI